MPYKDPIKRREQNRESVREWRLRNLDRKREISRNWARGHVDRHRANARKWREQNPEKRKAYIEATRDQANAYQREWHKRNPEVGRAKCNLRRARLLAADSPGVSVREWREIKETFCGLCAYCLKPTARPERDHVVAISRGGRDEPGNVVPACRRCNARKWNHRVFEWVRLVAA